MPRRKAEPPEQEAADLSPDEQAAAFRKWASAHNRAWDLERLLSQAEEQARDALARSGHERQRDMADMLLAWIGSLRRRMTPEEEALVTLAFKAGAVAERLGFVPLEAFGKQGWNATAKLVRAAKGRGTDPAAIARAVELFERLVAEGKKKAAAEKIAAGETGISPRTLRRHRAKNL